MIQRGYRTLVLWIIWCAATIVIYAGLYNNIDVWEFVRRDPSGITWIIILLFILGIITSFILTLLLTLEAVTVDKLETIAARSGWLGIDYTSKRFRVAKYFESLKTIVECNGDVNIEPLVNVEFSIYQRTAHALEVIGNLLITLGLVGTVVGLTLTLTGLTGSLEALGQDQEQLLSGLRVAMSGMGTAFYTTLLGSVLGGVLLRVFAHINENGVESLENALTRICLVHCSADFKPSTERDIRQLQAEIGTLATRVDKLQSCLNSASTAISNFNQEILQLRAADELGQEALQKTLIQRQKYLQSLRDEFQLKRLNRGAWWKVIVKGFRRE